MKTFYKIVDNKAQVGSGTFVPEDFIEYEIGNEPEELLLALEVDYEIERIQTINNKAGDIIAKKYPLYKQNNITLLLVPYTEIDLEEMKMYIETIRGIAKKAKEDGTNIENINWGGLD